LAAYLATEKSYYSNKGKKKMKVITTAAAAVLLTTAVNAADLGNGISFGGETDVNWGVDAEALTMTLTPELGYVFFGNDLTLSSDLDVYSAEEFQLDNALDDLVLDFKVTRDVYENLELYGKTSWDLDAAERGEITVGATFSF
jgi:hypothetical protein